MNTGDQSGSVPSGDFSQPRETLRDNLPAFENDRHESQEQEEASMFVEQDSSSSSASLEDEDQDQHEIVVLEDPEDGPQDGPNHDEDQRNNGPESPEQPGDDNDNEHSDVDEVVELIQQELTQEASNDPDEENEEDEGVGDLHEKSSKCSSCNILKGRLRRLEERVVRGDAIIGRKNDRMRRLLETILRLRPKLRDKDAEIQRLNRLLRLNHIDPHDRSHSIRSVPNPNATVPAPQGAWKTDVRNFYNSSIDNDGNYDEGAWEEVWKAQYKQGNISVNLNLLHPDIRLKGPYDESEDEPEDEPVGDNPVFSEESEEIRSNAAFTPAPRQADFKGFDKVPSAILIRILNEVLLFEGQVVHIFSRLDPYQPPADSRTARRIPGRIYISNGVRAYVSLTRDTLCPRSLLSPLCVNRKWHFFGAHIFYGTNTFAFSSFGEFGRFCKSIGKAKLQRIANLEIHWQGGSCVGFAEDSAGRDWRRTKEYRIMPVAYLPDMRSLDTLVIFIDESPMRRPWEDKSMIRYALKATEGQPNFREKRALRVCRGWDYLHMLRNLSWIRLYDTAQMNKTSQRNFSAVRDRSAVEDLNRTARMENTPEKAEECRLTSLHPLVPYRPGLWAPGEDDYQLILSILDRLQLRINDLDDYDRGGDGNGETGSESDSESESESETDNCTISIDGDEAEGEDEDEDEDEDDSGHGDGCARVHAQGCGCDDFNLGESSPRPKSEGGFVNHPAGQTQPIVIDVDAEDDEVQIIEYPRRREWRSASAITTSFRGESSTSESSLFVTPHPGERSSASATVSPSHRTVIDLTMPLRIKRSASSDRSEAKKRKIKTDT